VTAFNFGKIGVYIKEYGKITPDFYRRQFK